MAYEELKATKTIRWIISEFSWKEKNTCIKSNFVTFSYDQNVTTWSIKIYSDGGGYGDEEDVSLYLNLEAAKSHNFLAKWRITLQNENGLQVKQDSHECEGQDIEDYGSSYYITHEELSKHVKNCSSVTIICELSIYEPKQLKYENTSAKVSLPIQRNYKKMFEEEIFCDLDIKTNDGVTLKAHKTILAATSAVILKMLTTDMKEAKTSSVEIEDFDSKTIREMLRFIYCGEVKDFEGNAKKLIYATEKYEVTELKEKCIEEISSKLTKENVIEALIIADHISEADKLIKACLPIIDLYLLEMMKNPKWKTLSRNILEKLLTENWKASKICHV